MPLFSKVLADLKQFLVEMVNRVKDEIVQDCPPELYACEVCRKLDCNSIEWLECPTRLQGAEFVRALKMDPTLEIRCPYRDAAPVREAKKARVSNG
jgi:hypothetical protein